MISPNETEGVAPVAAAEKAPGAFTGILAKTSLLRTVFGSGSVPLVWFMPRLLNVGSHQFIGYVIDLTQCSDSQVCQLVEMIAKKHGVPLSVIAEDLGRQKCVPITSDHILGTSASLRLFT